MGLARKPVKKHVLARRKSQLHGVAVCGRTVELARTVTERHARFWLKDQPQLCGGCLRTLRREDREMERKLARRRRPAK